MNNIQVTMTKEMYDALLNGRAKNGNEPSIRGCGTPEKVVEYVDKAWGLLGHVTGISVE